MKTKEFNPARLTKEDKLKLIYRHTHRDYKLVLGGVGAILVLRAGGTSLVGMTSLTDAEIDDKLPYALKKEARRLLDKFDAANPNALEEARAVGHNTLEEAREHDIWLWKTAGNTHRDWMRGINAEKAALIEILATE